MHRHVVSVYIMKHRLVYYDLKVNVFGIILKGLSLAKKCKLSINFSFTENECFYIQIKSD